MQITNNGTCTAIEEASGDANYQYVYNGSWQAVNDDCIYISAKTEPKEYTYMMPYRTGVAPIVINYYLWRNGKITISPNYESYTRMTLSKK